MWVVLVGVITNYRMTETENQSINTSLSGISLDQSRSTVRRRVTQTNNFQTTLKNDDNIVQESYHHHHQEKHIHSHKKHSDIVRTDLPSRRLQPTALTQKPTQPDTLKSALQDSTSSDIDSTSTPYTLTSDSDYSGFDYSYGKHRKFALKKKKLPRRYTLLLQDEDDENGKQDGVKSENTQKEKLYFDWNGKTFTLEQIKEREQKHSEKKLKRAQEAEQIQKKMKALQKQKFYNSMTWSCILVTIFLVWMSVISGVVYFVFRMNAYKYIHQHVALLPDKQHSFQIEIPVCIFISFYFSLN